MYRKICDLYLFRRLHTSNLVNGEMTVNYIAAWFWDNNKYGQIVGVQLWLCATYNCNLSYENVKRGTGCYWKFQKITREPLKINRDNKKISHDFNRLAKHELYLLIIENKNDTFLLKFFDIFKRKRDFRFYSSLSLIFSFFLSFLNSLQK